MEEITKFIEQLLIQWGLPHWADYAGLVLALVVLFTGSIIPALWKAGAVGVNWLVARQASKDLHPYYTPDEIRRATRYYVQTKCQNIAPSKENEPGQTHAFAVRENLIPFFAKKAFRVQNTSQRFYIVLADSGMGKSTFMINLYIRYSRGFSPMKFKIRLLPLGMPNLDDVLTSIPESESKDTILLLDAFDEDQKAAQGYRKRLLELVEMTRNFRVVVITCRTQFFPREEEEPSETGVVKFFEGGTHSFKKLYLSPFDDNDINKYVRKKFSVFRLADRRRARSIVRRSPNLMVRPMLLSYIDDLLHNQDPLDSSSQIYGALIRRWIERESQKHDGDKGRYEKELYKFSNRVAIDLYEMRQERGGLFIPEAEITGLAERHGFRLSDIDVRSRSLLNRDAHGNYKFSHRSVQEYFLAEEMVIGRDVNFIVAIEGFEQAYLFFWEMTGGTMPDASTVSFDISRGSRLVQLAWLMAKCPELRYLWVDSPTSEELALITRLARLESLSVQVSEGASTAHMGVICGLYSLKRLELSVLGRFTIDLGFVAGMSMLESLQLSQTACYAQLSQNVVEVMSQLNGLKQLDLMETNITKEQYLRLKANLPFTIITTNWRTQL